MKKTFRIFGAGLTWLTLAVQYVLLVQGGEYGGIANSTFTFFGFFTILTNILVALAFSVPLMRPASRLRIFFQAQGVRAAIALYILIVMITYYGLLAKVHNPVGLNAVTNIGLHFLIPVLYIFDWLVFAGKDQMSFRRLPLWVAFPFAYGMFNIIRGALSGFYPYHFLNIAELGMGQVMINMAGFTAVYAIGGAVMIGLGRRLAKPGSTVQGPA